MVCQWKFGEMAADNRERMTLEFYGALSRRANDVSEATL